MKLKVPYNIKKTLFKVLPMALLMGTAFSSCKPDPEPWREVVIDWDWDDNLGWAPPKSVIKEHTDDKTVKTVFINLTSDNSTGYTPHNFHNARDTLQTRIDIDPNKVRGMGTIYVNDDNGAQLPDPMDWDNCGIALVDSLWFTANGWKVTRWQPPHSK